MVMDQTFKALSDPSRRKILALLRHRNLTAGDIARHFPVSKASISHHLGVLREAGLVVAERDGQFIHYSLNATVLQELVAHLMEFAPVRGRD